jgi:hypothetical protein
VIAKRRSLSRKTAAKVRGGIYTVLTIAAIALGRRAQAGPNDGYALSNDAALRGGAALVLGRDAGSVWYNPASAAATQRLRFDASLSAYALKFTQVPRALVIRTPNRVDSTSFHETQFQVVPSSVAFAGTWPKHRVAFAGSMHTSEYADLETRMHVSGSDSVAGFSYEETANLIATYRRYHAGLTMAWQPVPAFRIGTTLGGIYDSSLQFVRYGASANSSATPSSIKLVLDSDASARIAAFEPALGLQLELIPSLHVGASVRAPARVVFTKHDGGQSLAMLRTDAMGLSSDDSITLPSTGDEPSRWLTPWRVMAGVGWKKPNFEVEINGEYLGARSEKNSLWQRRPTWNVRAGASYLLVPKIMLGVGLFTDRTSQLASASIPDVVVHRYGGALALRSLTTVELGANERTSRLVFETTLGLRFAAGRGHATAVDLVVPAEGPDLSTLEAGRRMPATQQIVALHVGSGMRF